MNEQELKQLWQKQPVPEPAPTSTNAMIEQMNQKMRKFNRTLLWRDARELIACVFIIVWFGLNLRHAHSTLTKVGDIVLVLSGLFIGANLLAARRSNRAFRTPTSVRDFLGGELDRVNRQIKLLRTVLWWYLLPLFCGVSLFSIGANLDLVIEIPVLSTYALTFGFVYWINGYAVRKTLLPLKTELEQTLGSISECSE